jgi:RNA recognition motif-containing protein
MLEDNSYLRTVKIANLSVEANRDDVRELFGRFGWIGTLLVLSWGRPSVSLRDLPRKLPENVRVISEKAEEGDTSMAPRKGIGLAFVTFRSVEEAHRAVAAMDRYRYEHQLLKCVVLCPAPRL